MRCFSLHLCMYDRLPISTNLEAALLNAKPSSWMDASSPSRMLTSTCTSSSSDDDDDDSPPTDELSDTLWRVCCAPRKSLSSLIE